MSQSGSDSELPDRVAIPCPSCSQALETVHEVLSTGGGRVTLRCTECEHVHKEQLPEDDTVQRSVVVSQDGESFTTSVDVPEDEQLAVGEEFVAETDAAIMTVRITSLELDDDSRVESAGADEVDTIWTREVENVAVNVTKHPKDGRREDTESLTLQVPGDYEFTVGETEELGDYEFTVESFHVRDDAEGYFMDKLDHDGDTIVAKDVKRLYVRDETSTAWSAW
ncbi:HVO_0476 family zinc finger protein [Halorientalis salina]|uniref:HVO_0476 family zinc finger protein n=1 Tax=Halorientalis salina TaxID=2932266 RepID=UPI0010AD8B6C|nr:HVO_0476 family zinc finger protein [Halorientalis salina]